MLCYNAELFLGQLCHKNGKIATWQNVFNVKIAILWNDFSKNVFCLNKCLISYLGGFFQGFEVLVSDSVVFFFVADVGQFVV